MSLTRIACVPFLQSCAILMGCAIFLMGCGGVDRKSAVQALNTTNSKRLANLYTNYQSTHGWLGPKNEDDFKAYIASLPPNRMELMAIDPANIDDLFHSERDRQPFRIRYKVRGNFDASDPVIFEDKGVDGKRVVGFTGMTEREVSTEEEFNRLWAGKVERQQSTRSYNPETN